MFINHVIALETRSNDKSVTYTAYINIDTHTKRFKLKKSGDDIISNIPILSPNPSDTYHLPLTLLISCWFVSIACCYCVIHRFWSILVANLRSLFFSCGWFSYRFLVVKSSPMQNTEYSQSVPVWPDSSCRMGIRLGFTITTLRFFRVRMAMGDRYTIHKQQAALLYTL